MRPRTTWPSSTSANGASTACGARSANGPALEGRDQLGEVVVGVDAGVGLPGQLVGVEEVLLAEPRLDPRVEAGAEAGGRRRLARHRPGQLAGERLGVGRAAATSAVADSDVGQRHVDHLVAVGPAPRRRSRSSSRSQSATRRGLDHVEVVVGGRRVGRRAPRARPRAAARPRGPGRARATGGTGRRRRTGWGRPWPASPASALGHRLAPGRRAGRGPRPGRREGP